MYEGRSVAQKLEKKFNVALFWFDSKNNTRLLLFFQRTLLDYHVLLYTFFVR